MAQSIDVFNYKTISEGMGTELKNATAMSPLALAFIGDGVYELIIRSRVINGADKNVNSLNKESSNYAKAPTQAAIVKYLMDNELISEDEKAVFKRGRNAKSHTQAKNASILDYRVATGFETLIGFLYISGKTDRAIELVKTGLDYISKGTE